MDNYNLKKSTLIVIILLCLYCIFINLFSIKVKALDLGSPSKIAIRTDYSNGFLGNANGYNGWETTEMTKFKISESYFTDNDFEYNIVANYSGQASYRAKGFVSRNNSYYQPVSNHYFVFSVYSRIQLDTVNSYVGDEYSYQIGNITCRSVETITSSDSPHYFYNFNCNTENINRAIYEIGIRFQNNNDTLYSPINFGISNFYSFDNETGANEFFTALVDTTSNLTNEDVNAIDNVVRDILGVLEDDSIDNNNISSDISSWGSQLATNGVITSLVTLPIQLLQAIVNGIQTTCTPFVLGSLMGTNLSFPCLDLSTYLGTTLFTTIDILISGFMIYKISKKLVKIFNDFTNLKSNQIDELYGGGR